MANGFKRFIETSGLSLDELREKINKMALDLAVDIVDDATQLMPKEIRSKARQTVRAFHNQKEYKSEKIPPRKEQSRNLDNGDFKVTKIYPRKGAMAEISDNSAFSDEEYKDLLKAAVDESGDLHYDRLRKSKSHLREGPSEAPYDEPSAMAYPHEAIIGEQSEQDEYMAEKIRQMRQLEEISHNGYIVKRCVEVTMVRQGEFMKDVEDDYLQTAFCGVQRPVYAALSRSQLRTYFTWRTGWRRGLHSVTDKPYILLYCYEVLNKIGFDSSEAAFRELLLIWNELSDHALYLRDFLPRWIKDFYAFNKIDAPLPELPPEHTSNCDITKLCSEILSGNYKNKLDYLADNSSYNIRCSVFVDSKNKPYIDGACESALTALDRHFKKFGVELSGLICGKMKKDHSWSPFGGAPVDLDRMDGFEPLRINELEGYCKKRSEPVLELFEFAPSKDFIGYVLKCVEARLRKIMAFSHKLSPNINMIKNELANRGKLQSAVSDKAFDTLIADAVDLYCRQNHIGASIRSDDNAADYSAVSVEIDISKLEEIREQAKRNTELLIVPDAERLSEDSVLLAADMVADDEFSESVATVSDTDGFLRESADSAKDSEPIGVLTSDKFVITNPENINNEAIVSSGALDGLPEEWQEFAMALIPDHISVMAHIFDGTLSKFCREHGLFSQTLFEEINSAALDTVGDVIIEDGNFVEDYKEYIERLITLIFH